VYSFGKWQVPGLENFHLFGLGFENHIEGICLAVVVVFRIPSEEYMGIFPGF
jgi:hypothetical protein